MGDSTGYGSDSGAEEGFAPPDRAFGSEGDHRSGFPAPPSLPPQRVGVLPPAPGAMRAAYPVGHAGYYPPPSLGTQTSGMATAGLVLGVLSLVLCWTPLAPVLAVSGIVFSCVGMARCRKPQWSGMGLAVTGLVCALLSVMIWVAVAALIAALWF